jgi:hypothetical protein
VGAKPPGAKSPNANKVLFIHKYFSLHTLQLSIILRCRVLFRFHQHSGQTDYAKTFIKFEIRIRTWDMSE